MSGWASANRPSRCTSHLAAKSGDVLTVRTPEVWRCTRRSVPTAIRSSASRTTARYSRPASVITNRWRSRLKSLTQYRLQRLDLMAHGSLRDTQLFGRSGEALAPRRGLEGLEGIQRWQTAKHRSAFMRKTKAEESQPALRCKTRQLYRSGSARFNCQIVRLQSSRRQPNLAACISLENLMHGREMMRLQTPPMK